MDIQGIYLNITTVICGRPTVNIVFNGENRNKSGCPLLPLLFNMLSNNTLMLSQQQSDKKIEKEIKYQLQIGTCHLPLQGSSHKLL